MRRCSRHLHNDEIIFYVVDSEKLITFARIKTVCSTLQMAPRVFLITLPYDFVYHDILTIKSGKDHDVY